MILWSLILVPLCAAPLALWAERRSRDAPRWVALAAMTVDLFLALGVWTQDQGLVYRPNALPWLMESRLPWVPRWGISLHLGIDGFALVLVVLTALLGLVAVIASWTEIQERVGWFHFNVLGVLAGVAGVFLSLDLLLFFLFWEVMLVPMYLLIAIWGHEHRRYASFKFFVFTQAGSLLLLAAIVTLALMHWDVHGVPSFDYGDLLSLEIDDSTARWLLVGFFIGFAVKLPAVPFHTWLPDAHTEAPTGGSVLLAGLLLKTGAYGLMRFAIPLFPDAAKEFSPFAMWLGVAGILYGAVLAFAQTDFKRLIAYSSISHLGFALVGMFAMTGVALQGAAMQLVAHGISTGALFMLAGALQERLHTRDMRRMGGLWSTVPRLGALALFFAIASLGLPGLGNFIGEVLVLFGSFPEEPVITMLAATGLVLAAAYSLALLQRTFFGPPADDRTTHDLSRFAFGSLLAMAILQIALGLHPGIVLQKTAPATNFIVESEYHRMQVPPDRTPLSLQPHWIRKSE
jgi:NADH-quinone oxidoreductase subunit M